MKSKFVLTGASSDIGIAIAKKLLPNFESAILQVNSNKAKVKESFKVVLNKIKIIECNFENKSELETFCKTLDEPELLINSAAYIKNDLLVGTDDDEIEKMLMINTFAFTKICKAVIPSMVGKRKGNIINISSITATRGNRGQAVYAGTKGYVESFTRSLAAEYGAKGVRVNAVAPGAIKAGNMNTLLGYAEKEVKESMISKRLGTPEDIANAVAFLASDESEFINGKVLQVDGGFYKGV